MGKAAYRMSYALMLACLTVTLCAAHPQRTSQIGLMIYDRDGDYIVFNEVLVVNKSVYIGGCTGSFENCKWTLLKFGANGSLVAAYYGERGYIMSIASDGLRVYVAGVLMHEALPKTTGFLAAFTLDLEKLWEKEWRGSPVFSGFEGLCLVEDSLYAAGEAYYEGARGFDIVLQKLSKDGVLIWEKTFNMEGQQEAGALVVSAGKAYIAGTTSPLRPNGKCDGIVIIYDERSGAFNTVIWGGEGRDFFKSIEIGDALYVCGFTDSYGEGGLDGLLLKLDPRGETIWWRTLGGPGDDAFIDLATRDGKVHVVGHATVNGSMLPAYWQYSYQGALLGSWLLPVSNLSTWTSIYPAYGVIHVVGNAEVSPFRCYGIYALYATSYIVTVNLPRDDFWAALDGENKTGRRVSFETPAVERKLEVTRYAAYGGSRLAFDCWSDGVCNNPRTLRIAGDIVLNATYRVEHRVTVSSEYGEVSGEGWYSEGSTATVSVRPSRVQGLIAVHVFDGWYESGEKVSSLPVYSFEVVKPVQLKAVWRTELSFSPFILVPIILLLVPLLLLALFLARRKRERPPPPPPPPTSMREGARRGP